ncbi:hypothetical protein GCM10018779_58480 [Streptomyces griseocarneus]|nr:hypothetical protein GCM10018779_58480 [Streptomyces griseocarneus]
MFGLVPLRSLTKSVAGSFLFAGMVDVHGMLWSVKTGAAMTTLRRCSARDGFPGPVSIGRRDGRCRETGRAAGPADTIEWQ